MNESSNTSYHTEIRGKAMAYWYVFVGRGGSYSRFNHLMVPENAKNKTKAGNEFEFGT